MANKGNKRSLFWTSYSDLMTSLFFTVLVLFIVTVIAMGRAKQATEDEIKKIKAIENSIQNIDTTWFEYDTNYKKHILKIDVSFPQRVSDISAIPLAKREELYQAGLAIDKFLKYAEETYGEDVKYLLIIEGQASRDNFAGNDTLSYNRALSLYRYFENNRHLHLKRDNCEVLICGSGTEGVLRSQPDNALNSKNQRFLIHILPKPGVIQ